MRSLPPTRTSDSKGNTATPSELERVGDILPRVLDMLMEAGLRHELSWSAVKRIVDQLPVEDGCRWCDGYLDRIDGGWRCRACGRIDTDWYRSTAGADRPNRERAREPWRPIERRSAA